MVPDNEENNISPQTRSPPLSDAGEIIGCEKIAGIALLLLAQTMSRAGFQARQRCATLLNFAV